MGAAEGRLWEQFLAVLRAAEQLPVQPPCDPLGPAAPLLSRPPLPSPTCRCANKTPRCCLSPARALFPATAALALLPFIAATLRPCSALHLLCCLRPSPAIEQFHLASNKQLPRRGLLSAPCTLLLPTVRLLDLNLYPTPDSFNSAAVSSARITGPASGESAACTCARGREFAAFGPHLSRSWPW